MHVRHTLRAAPLLLLLAGCRPTALTIGDDTAPVEHEEDCDTERAFRDADGDGYGAGAAVTVCVDDAGYSDADGDCDDAAADVHPGVEELCNGRDDDCDGELDPTGVTWYTDADGDGYGDPATAHADCDGGGDVALGEDCDDADPTVSPGADDACEDGLDSDCDGRDQGCGFEGAYDLGEAVDAKVYSANANYGSGEYLDVGDLNGDGFGDVALTTFSAGAGNGGAYVVYGPLDGERTLEDAGDQLRSRRTTYAAGRSIAVGDLDGDGLDDVAVGAADESCKEFVNFGPLGGDRELTESDLLRTGTSNTEMGHGSDVADVNGDGQADLIVGAYEDDTSGRDAGAIFVEWGPLTAGEARMADVAGLTLLGEANDAYSGRYVHAGGDVDGDGIGDLLIAAPYASGAAPAGGGVYLVYGGRTGTVGLADADAKYVGVVPSEYAGEGGAMGDVDGDGLADLLVGSMSNQGASSGGAVYVVLGPGLGIDRLSDADSVMRGGADGQLFGLGLSAEDMDGDGVGDLLVGARGDNGGGRGSGAAYLYWGPLAGGLGPSDADATFLGPDATDATGAATAQGDLDGDGDLDVILGAPGDSTGGVYGGAILVEYLGD